MATETLTEFRRTDEHSENFNKGVENIEKFQEKKMKLKNTMTKLKNTPEGFSRRLNEAEEKISELKDRAEELTHQGNKKKKRTKVSTNSLKDLLENIKLTNICITTVPEERRESDKETENLSEEIMA